MRAYRSIVDPTGKRKKEQRKVKLSGEVTIMDDEAPALVCRLSNTGTLMHRITSRHVFNATIFGAWRLSGTRLRHGTCSRLCKPAAWSFPEGSTLLGPSWLHLFSLVIDTTSSRDSGSSRRRARARFNVSLHASSQAVSVGLERPAARGQTRRAICNNKGP